MPMLPWWGKILLSLALRFGLPAVTKFLAPELAEALKAALEWILAAPTAAERDARAKAAGVKLRECVGDQCPVK